MRFDWKLFTRMTLFSIVVFALVYFIIVAPYANDSTRLRMAGVLLFFSFVIGLIFGIKWPDRK